MAGRRQENQRWVVSGYVNDKVKKGDTLEIMAPSGKFFRETNKEVAKNYIMFAAGVASRPFCLSSKPIWHSSPTALSVVLFNRSVKSIIFKEEIELLKNKYFGVLKFSISDQGTPLIELFNGVSARKRWKS
jgi:ring-1,2-phenylacetyl-CoA epoxidase subunit PaaE